MAGRIGDFDLRRAVLILPPPPEIDLGRLESQVRRRDKPGRARPGERAEKNLPSVSTSPGHR